MATAMLHSSVLRRAAPLLLLCLLWPWTQMASLAAAQSHAACSHCRGGLHTGLQPLAAAPTVAEPAACHTPKPVPACCSGLGAQAPVPVLVEALAADAACRCSIGPAPQPSGLVCQKGAERAPLAADGLTQPAGSPVLPRLATPQRLSLQGPPPTGPPVYLLTLSLRR